ncbi:PorP/SprF family type IX secretion system membrane protein [Flagellimonas flava]|uniref:Type IX secretion system membrane protein, PorP/SprF family n=1 Tax=Flagellimonas flava TaxID=570519 RepID=A0A1M5IBB8_9FLAO|nr:PorP/SprF family type IX secretion system membrane protein [Allomuricauda flava]SHG25200.1 type IX secretion system membrane protein, PorP/SprF family [Allomuricauda flava]
MLRHFSWYSLVLMVCTVTAQETVLPTDFRQHNLTQFNASLLNPAFGLDWNKPSSVSIWSRWQWQTLDGDPTTIFANYTQQINTNSAAGVGFLQHNTGTYLNTGLNLNYVHGLELDGNIRLLFGLNVFGFREELADDRFTPDPDIDLPELENTDDFILMFSPGLQLQIDKFGLGLAVENAVDVNFSDSGRGRGDGGTVVFGTLSYDFPVMLFGGTDDNFVRPILYVKSIPDGDTQFGLNSLFSTSWFWVQAGYNNFYGASGGLGITLARHFSVGGLMEFGGDEMLSDDNSTLELVVSYHWGASDARKKVVDFDVEKDDALARARMQAEAEKLRKEEQAKREAELLENERIKLEADRLEEESRLREAEAVALAQQQKKDSLEAANAIAEARRLAEHQQKKDSLDSANAFAEAQRRAEQQRLDSIAKVQAQKVEVRPNEKYEEVKSAGGLEPGFYLIANVFGTKKYYENFMAQLQKRGLQPKSFYREVNKYRYVYLNRYDTMDEARKARDSKFFGRYTDKTWIFRVRGN